MTNIGKSSGKLRPIRERIRHIGFAARLQESRRSASIPRFDRPIRQRNGPAEGVGRIHSLAK